MTLMEHLYELRHRMFFAVLAVFIGAVLGFVWFSIGIPALHIAPLGDILIGPYCSIPTSRRATFDGAGTCQFLASTAFSALQLRLTSGVMSGVLLSCPFWLYQIWAYTGPALHSKEKRFALTFTAVGAVLFAGGMVLAYLVIPEALNVLLGFGSDFVIAGLDPVKYYKFLIGMMLVFGVSLELPLLLVMLNFAGVIKGAQLAHARRYAFFGLVLFSGFAVPGNDPISMGVLAVTLCILYEVAVQVTKARDRRKGKVAAAASFADLSDDEASPLDTDATASGGVAASSGDSSASSDGPSASDSFASNEKVTASEDIGAASPIATARDLGSEDPASDDTASDDAGGADSGGADSSDNATDRWNDVT